jgi:hypothetical protein
VSDRVRELTCSSASGGLRSDRVETALREGDFFSLHRAPACNGCQEEERDLVVGGGSLAAQEIGVRVWNGGLAFDADRKQ